MRVLLVRLSSMGDVLHTLPAVTDAAAALPDLELDWLVEPAFAEIARWHPGVRQVIPFGLRALKRDWRAFPRTVTNLRRDLRNEHYAAVVDAQGLLKSAIAARLAGAPVHGLDARAAREPLATRLYRHRHPVPAGLHVAQRHRLLLAAALGLVAPEKPPDYGLAALRQRLLAEAGPAELALPSRPFVLGLHGSTWPSKLWPERHWQMLARGLERHDRVLLLPWGSAAERGRAGRIAAAAPQAVRVLPRLSLQQLAWLLVRAAGWVGVESGLGHLAAALELPGVMLHGPTDPAYSGVQTEGTRHRRTPLPCAPCLKRICPLPLNSAGEPLCQASLEPQATLAALLTAR